MATQQVDIHMTIIPDTKGPLFNYTGLVTITDSTGSKQAELPATEVVAHIMEFVKALALTAAKLQEEPTVLR